MEKVNAKIGTDYKPFNYYGAADATEDHRSHGFCLRMLLRKLIDYLNSTGHGKSASSKYICTDHGPTNICFNVMPKTVKKIAVLDRTKEPGGTRRTFIT